MKESYGEGLATYTGPGSCGGIREGVAEASTGVRAGRVFSRERASLRGADAVRIGGRPHGVPRHGERDVDPARSETLRTLENTMLGNREILELAAADGFAVRVGKPTGVHR
jgi:hypothetical protein